MTQLAFPKPKNLKVTREAFKVCDDQREICYTFGMVKASKKGRDEYRRRLKLMHERQKAVCCLSEHCPVCPGALCWEESTFDHENTRKERDDRIVLPNGRWQNGACHAICNVWKGSRRIPYNAAIQARMEKGTLGC